MKTNKYRCPRCKVAIGYFGNPKEWKHLPQAGEKTCGLPILKPELQPLFPTKLPRRI